VKISAMKTRPVVALVLAGGAFGLMATGGAEAAKVRRPAVAGTYYPDSRASVIAAARYLFRLAESAPSLGGRPVAVVLPHAGWPFSGLAAATALRQLQPGDFDRVVVVGPAHGAGFTGYALDDTRAWRTPLGDVPVCAEALARIRGGDARLDASPGLREHSIEVLLPLLQVALRSFCLVPVLAGETDAEQEKAFAKRLAALHDGRTLFVFSGDLVHYGPRYGFTPFGPRAEAAGRVHALEDEALRAIGAGDAAGLRVALTRTKAPVCGAPALRLFLELIGEVAPGRRPALLARYSSSDLPWSGDENDVGYATLAVTRDGTTSGLPLRAVPEVPEAANEALPPDLGRRLVALARAAVSTELLGGEALDRALLAVRADLPFARQGVFVSLYRKDAAAVAANGRLRGCQGQPTPTLPIDLGTVQAALDAAFRDSRFPRLHARELDEVQFEVTLLSPLRPLGAPEEIRIGTHGVVLEKGDKGALYLPQVPKDARWSVAETLDELAKKAKLPKNGWREGARLAVFTGQVFAESP